MIKLFLCFTIVALLHNSVKGLSNWTAMPAPPACYRDISMVSTTVGFAVAEEGIVVATADGKSWKSVLSSGGQYYWYGVHAFDTDNVIISGFIDGGSESLGVVRYTSDGGKTWSNDTVVDASAWLTSELTFINSTHGFVMSSLSCRGHATSDGGKTFSTVSICSGWMSDRFQFGADGSIAVAGTSFCLSNGTSWPPKFNCVDSVDPDGDASPINSGSIWFVAGGIIAPSVSGWVHKSTDSRSTWGPRVSFPYPIREVFMLDKSTYLLAGGNFESGVGGIHISEDGGATWSVSLASGIEHHSIVKQSTMLYTVGCGRGSAGIYYADQH